MFGFLSKNPRIRKPTLELDDRFVNVLTEGYDAGRTRRARGRNWRYRETPRGQSALPGGVPEYLKRCGTPASLQDLEQHKGIIYSNRGSADWRFRTGRKLSNVHPEATLRVNNGLLMRDAAIAGLGIALLPTFLLADPLIERTLKVIDVGPEAEGATIYIAYLEHLRSSGKIRALVTWLQKSFGDPAYWDDGSTD